MKKMLLAIALVASSIPSPGPAPRTASAQKSPAPASRGINVRPADEYRTKKKLYDESHALIIGVSKYTWQDPTIEDPDKRKWKDLPGVREDVREVTAVLVRHGFDVKLVADTTREGIRNAVDKFIDDYGHKPDNRLLIYFAGHGYTGKSPGDNRRLGYIVPSDAPLPAPGTDHRFDEAAISMETIKRYAVTITARHALFVFDSCFSGSVFLNEPPSKRSSARSRQTMEAVRQFITAGTEEQEVPDASHFRESFVGGLNGEADTDKDGYVTGRELGLYVHRNVKARSGGKQTPRVEKISDPKLSLGDFVFPLAALAQPPPAKLSAIRGLAAYWSADGHTIDTVGGHVNAKGAVNYTGGVIGRAFGLDGKGGCVRIRERLEKEEQVTLTAWFKTDGPPGDAAGAIISSTQNRFIHLRPDGAAVYLLNYGEDANDDGEGFRRGPQVTVSAVGKDGKETPLPPRPGEFKRELKLKPHGAHGATAGAWRHVALVIRHGDTRLYLDGELAATDNTPFAWVWPTADLRIGCGFSDGDFFRGAIDEVYLFRRALTQAEVRTIYAMR